MPTVAYQDGDQVIIEDQYGEVMENLKLTTKPVRAPDIGSIHSMESLERHLTQYSTGLANTQPTRIHTAYKKNYLGRYHAGHTIKKMIQINVKYTPTVWTI